MRTQGASPELPELMPSLDVFWDSIDAAHRAIKRKEAKRARKHARRQPKPWYRPERY